MNPVENAIRNALQKGDETDPAFRKRVYASASQAMQRALDQRGLSAEETRQRRAAIAGVVAKVERGYVDAGYGAKSEPAPEPAAPPVTQGLDRLAATLDEAPSRESASGNAPTGPHAAEPSFEAETPVKDAAPELTAKRDRDPQPEATDDGLAHDIKLKTKRGPVATLLAVTIVVVALLMAIWWVISTGLLAEPDPNTGPVPNPRNETEESFSAGPPPKLGDAQDNDTRDWINVFAASDPTGVRVPAGTSAQLRNEAGVAGVVISAQVPESAVSFPIGEGVLQTLAGKSVVFDLIMRTGDESATVPISVTCDFAGLGDCVRKRYEVGHEFGEYLFVVDLPAGRPTGGGWISIVPDTEGTGRPIMIERIRVAERLE